MSREQGKENSLKNTDLDALEKELNEGFAELECKAEEAEKSQRSPRVRKIQKENAELKKYFQDNAVSPRIKRMADIVINYLDNERVSHQLKMHEILMDLKKLKAIDRSYEAKIIEINKWINRYYNFKGEKSDKQMEFIGELAEVSDIINPPERVKAVATSSVGRVSTKPLSRKPLPSKPELPLSQKNYPVLVDNSEKVKELIAYKKSLETEIKDNTEIVINILSEGIEAKAIKEGLSTSNLKKHHAKYVQLSDTQQKLFLLKLEPNFRKHARIKQYFEGLSQLENLKHAFEGRIANIENINELLIKNKIYLQYVNNNQSVELVEVFHDLIGDLINKNDQLYSEGQKSPAKMLVEANQALKTLKEKKENMKMELIKMRNEFIEDLKKDMEGLDEETQEAVNWLIHDLDNLRIVEKTPRVEKLIGASIHWEKINKSGIVSDKMVYEHFKEVITELDKIRRLSDKIVEKEKEIVDFKTQIKNFSGSTKSSREPSSSPPPMR